MQKLFGFLSFLAVGSFTSLAALGTIEPGFRDPLKVFKEELVLSADASLRELSKRFNVPISFESGISPLFPEPSGIVVKLDPESNQPVEVRVGSGVIQRGLLSSEDERRLAHVMTALIKESLSTSAVTAGIQYLKNSFESRISEGSSSKGWEREVFIGLVSLFFLLVALTYFLDGTNPPAIYPRHPFEG